LVLLTGLFLFVCGCATPAPVAAPDTAGTGQPARPITILVAMDGFRADYLDRGLTPNLAALAERGVTAPMRPSFPSVTLPNLYTLLTGQRPDRHGVVGNRFLSADRKSVFGDSRAAGSDAGWWNGALPLWASAEAQGIGTAHMFYLTPGVDAAGRTPARYRAYDEALAPVEEPEALLAWLDVPEAGRPRFLTLYFYPADSKGHAHGPNSPELEAALRELDIAVGNLMAGLARRGLSERTNIVFVADHGMSEVSPERTLALDRLVPAEQLAPVSLGPFAALDVAPGASLDEVAGRLVGRHGAMECWRKEDMPARFRFGSHPRIAPLFCLADRGWTIVLSPPPEPAATRGNHGFDPYDPEMAALFVAVGPAFRRGVRLAPFDNVHVYPLLAHVAGVRPEPGDGDLAVLRPALAD
jgi:predicted AlkP superfamily pyrophosphatase or phosphodiesterase